MPLIYKMDIWSSIPRRHPPILYHAIRIYDFENEDVIQ
jgi:hypothetical protein